MTADVDYEGNWLAVTDAIGKLTAENLDRPGLMTGYVIMVSTSRYDEDGDMCFTYDYAVAPDTDLIRAIGLTELGYRRMRSNVDSSDPEV